MNTFILKQAVKENLTERIPDGIGEYIKNHFEGSFLSDIKKESDMIGEFFYRALISHDNTLFHLKFNSEGTIIENEMEPIWELCDDDDFIID